MFDPPFPFALHVMKIIVLRMLNKEFVFNKYCNSSDLKKNCYIRHPSHFISYVYFEKLGDIILRGVFGRFLGNVW